MNYLTDEDGPMIRPLTQSELEEYEHAKRMWILYCEKAQAVILELIGFQTWYTNQYERMPKSLQESYPNAICINLLDLENVLDVIQDAHRVDFLDSK